MAKVIVATLVVYCCGDEQLSDKVYLDALHADIVSSSIYSSFAEALHPSPIPPTFPFPFPR